MPLPTSANTKKAIWRNLLSIQNKAISLVAMPSKDWSRKITPLSNLTPASLSVEWKLTATAELNCEIYPNSKENAGKFKSVFCHKSSPARRKAWTLLRKLQELKNTLEKVVVSVNQEAIWLEFWMKGTLVTVGIFVRFCWWFSNQFGIVSETHFNCDTVGRELWLAILSSLLCPETDRNIRIGKQGYVFILCDFSWF